MTRLGQTERQASAITTNTSISQARLINMLLAGEIFGLDYVSDVN